MLDTAAPVPDTALAHLAASVTDPVTWADVDLDQTMRHNVARTCDRYWSERTGH